MKELICKIFGHKYRYYFTMLQGQSVKLRCCKRCHDLQEFGYFGRPEGFWTNLVSYTDSCTKKNKGDFEKGIFL